MTEIKPAKSPFEKIIEDEWGKGIWRGLDWHIALNGTWTCSPKEFADRCLARYSSGLKEAVKALELKEPDANYTSEETFVFNSALAKVQKLLGKFSE